MSIVSTTGLVAGVHAVTEMPKKEVVMAHFFGVKSTNSTHAGVYTMLPFFIMVGGSALDIHKRLLFCGDEEAKNLMRRLEEIKTEEPIELKFRVVGILKKDRHVNDFEWRLIVEDITEKKHYVIQTNNFRRGIIEVK